jgi:hypothetical protein
VQNVERNLLVFLHKIHILALFDHSQRCFLVGLVDCQQLLELVQYNLCILNSYLEFSSTACFIDAYSDKNLVSLLWNSKFDISSFSLSLVTIFFTIQLRKYGISVRIRQILQVAHLTFVMFPHI